MLDINQIIQRLIKRNQSGERPITLLAVCPNSAAVLEAAVKAAAKNRSIMLFAATLNQVDFEASYTDWTPKSFVQKMAEYAQIYDWDGALYPCLDHGGPWLKDLHTLEHLSYLETMEKVKTSITACVHAGYKLLHIDPTVDRTYPKGEALPLDLVVERTVELIGHAEKVRTQDGAARLAYEVGTEEVHGGMVDFKHFEAFVSRLRERLDRDGLEECWPCLFVAQVGTDLHTTQFDGEAARKLSSILEPLGSLAKGHYTDWVDNPGLYPACGMGGANVGPEFTAEEYLALKDLDEVEKEISGQTNTRLSNFMQTLQEVVVASGRWKKWLQPVEIGKEFNSLANERQDWLLKTGARYIWNDEQVVRARFQLYRNLENKIADPHQVVVDRISRVVEKYIHAFNLGGSSDLFG